MWNNLPDGASLVEGPVDLNRGAAWERACDRSRGVAVVEDPSGGQDLPGEPGRDHNAVVLSRLVCRDKDRVRLADVHV